MPFHTLARQNCHRLSDRSGEVEPVPDESRGDPYRYPESHEGGAGAIGAPGVVGIGTTGARGEYRFDDPGEALLRSGIGGLDGGGGGTMNGVFTSGGKVGIVGDSYRTAPDRGVVRTGRITA
jgi:hypothetical protein